MQLISAMSKNKLVLAAAGSGKTTFLINKALEIKDKNVLITTYTEANEEEIKKKIVKKTKGFIPKNIFIQTWFTFLLKHGVRPYQGAMNDLLFDRKIGFCLTDKQSVVRYYNNKGIPVCWKEEENFQAHYFSKYYDIYSDKVAKFIIKCNRKTKGEVIRRISCIYKHIMVDEVQDLAGWDLEILKLLFKSKARVLLVGDPRQVTYLTHHSRKYEKYKYGGIEGFIRNELRCDLCDIDETTLQASHRNNKKICELSSKLFPKHNVCKPCECTECRKTTSMHDGVYLVKEDDVGEYCKIYKPVVLRERNAVFPEWNYGKSKGLSFDRVLIYPTEPIRNWIKNNNSELLPTSRCKLYVAITRAKYSVGIVYNYSEKESYEGIEKLSP